MSANCRSKIISRLPTLSLLRVEPRRIGIPKHGGSNGVHQGSHSQSSGAAPSTRPSVPPSIPRHRHLAPEVFSDPFKSNHRSCALQEAPPHTGSLTVCLCALSFRFLLSRKVVIAASTSQDGCENEVRYSWREIAGVRETVTLAVTNIICIVATIITPTGHCPILLGEKEGNSL